MRDLIASISELGTGNEGACDRIQGKKAPGNCSYPGSDAARLPAEVPRRKAQAMGLRAILLLHNIFSGHDKY
ncbi:MAG: hypothetical protein AMDU1_APLC00046G0049 [Thermoplasmatales archaeon A-plasma]|nr:MAG: hypothetical protein AMDU1_APLC00046G0049 [Thermoplasmatales archaeon A-plasma]